MTRRGESRRWTPEDIRTGEDGRPGGGRTVPNFVPSGTSDGLPRGIPGLGRPQPTIPPFWLEKPPSATDFYFNEVGILAAGVGQQLLFGVGRVLLPATNKGVVKYLTIFVDSPTTALDVTWTLLVNGAAYPGWTYRSFPRLANNLDIVFPGSAHVGQGTRIEILAENRSAAGPWTIGGELGGWHWPKIDEDQAFGTYIQGG